MIAMSLSSAVSVDSAGGGCGDWSSANTASPTFGAIVCTAATRWIRKRAGSLSRSSSDSQATFHLQTAAHALTSVVLPKPAGAETRVRLRCRPSSIRSTKWRRMTALGGGAGTYSFVARTGVDIDPYFNGRRGSGGRRARERRMLHPQFAQRPDALHQQVAEGLHPPRWILRYPKREPACRWRAGS